MVIPKDLEGLPPDERIKRLRKLEDERRREIKEAEALIKRSREEMAATAETIRKIPVPQMRAIDPSTLFSREERALFETHHQTKATRDEAPAPPARRPESSPESLEEAVAGAPRQNNQDQIAFQYGKKLEETLAMAYKGLAEMSGKIEEKGYMNAMEKEKIDFYKNTLEHIHDAVGHVHGTEGNAAMAMVYGGLERISEMEKQMGYAQKGGQGHNPKYRI